ncbi:hypothetical protein ILUMI_09164 [Ignelater luminosus]|uniref:CHK kinase-like domain-containing protein n=1 Tax=Ignelater luminosus TaxID=2038154 RepID=A0A8K0D4E2_IGNLU|nr:hypothetical protein ILUMI_09164 [Ignelater luminosus]
MGAEHVSLVKKKYAQLHALSFVLRDEDLGKFKEITNSIDDMFTKFTEKINYKLAVKHISLKSLRSLRENVNKEAYKLYKDHINNMDKIFEDVKNAVNDDYVTVLHGDCWTNNILFKYNDSNNLNKPISVRFIDFQIAKWGLPVLDIAWFLCTCSEKEVIEQLEDYLRLYHNSLAAHLIKLGSNPDKVYSHSVFLKQRRKYARFGLTLAVSIIYLLLSDESEAVNLDNVAEAV